MMPVEARCTCGQKYRLPESAIGRQARCRKCGAVFNVPGDPELPPLPLEPEPRRKGATAKAGASAKEEPYAWLDEFARVESGAPREASPTPPVATGGDRYGSPVAAGGDRYGSPVATGGDRYGPGPAALFDDEADDAIVSSLARGRFTRDLLGSFALLLEPGNVITLLIIAFLYLWMDLLAYSRTLGLIGMGLVGGYLCAYYLSVIAETAGGEDDLPSVKVTNAVDDILLPLFQVMVTLLLVMAPALLVDIGSRIFDWEVSSTTYHALMIMGAFFWPAMVLIVAIGGSLRGLWPHTIIRTALAAPLAYLLLWIFLLLPWLLEWVTYSDLIPPATNARAAFGLSIAGALWSAVTLTLAMRAIGLYYRHFKHRFPWAAE